MQKSKNFLKKIGLKEVVLGVIILYFIAFSSYFSLKLEGGIFPDEGHHYEVSVAYSKVRAFSGMPENSEETYKYGDITRVPSLYYWLNARIINFNKTEIPDIIVLRLLSVLFGAFTLLFIYLLSREVIEKKWLQILPVYLLSNTLMFVFLNGAVNYDNPMNFLAISSVFFFIKYIKDLKIHYLLLFIVCSLLGILIKFTMLPLFVILSIILIYMVFVKRKYPKSIQIDFKNILLAPSILVMLFFIGKIYISNLVDYGSLTPSCDAVLGHDICISYGKIYMRDDALNRIDIFTKEGLDVVFDKRLSPFEYFFDWVQRISGTIYGITGHKTLDQSRWFVSFYPTLFLILFVVAIRKYSPKFVLVNILSIASVFYAFILFVYQNYRTYLITGNFGVALQGRYLFPVLPLFYIVMVYYVERINNRILRSILIIVLLLGWLYGCLYFFITNYPNSWFKVF